MHADRIHCSHRVRDAVAVGLILTFVLADSAWAYIDPGAGSYVFQLMIAFAVSMIFVLKSYWRRMLDFLRNRFSGKHDGESK